MRLRLMPGFLAEVLTWPENYSVAVAVETAINLKMPPLNFILLHKNSAAWSGLDKKLALAHTIMSNEVCQSCGQPIWVCRSTDNNIDFSIRTATCHAKAKIEKTEESRSKRRNGKLKPGQYLYPVAQQVNGEPIPKGARQEYFKSLSEE